MATRQRKTAQTPKPTDLPPVGMRSVTKTEKYIEAAPEASVEIKSNQTIITGFAPEDQGDAARPDDFDPIEAWLDRIDEEQGLRLRVDRVKNYEITKTWGRGADYMYCGEFPVSKATLLTDSYLGAIQDAYGAGNYRLSLRYSNGKIIKNFFAQIEAPKVPVIGTASPMATLAPLDPLIEITKQVELINKFRAALSFGEQPQTAVRTEQAPVASIEERLLNLVIDKAGKESPDKIDHLLDRVLGKNEPSDSWTNLVKDLIVSFAPAINSIITSYVQTAQGQPPQAQQTTQAGFLGVQFQERQGIQPGSDQIVIASGRQIDAPPVEVPLFPDTPFGNFCAILRLMVISNQEYNLAIDAYYSYCENNIDETNFQQVEVFTVGTPQQILDLLQVAPNIQTLSYTIELQKRIISEAQTEEEHDD